MAQPANYARSFLDLPPEVRRMVYFHFLSTQTVRIEFEKNASDPSIRVDRTLIPHSHTRVHVATNLFLINKTVALDVLPLFFRLIVFEFIDCPWITDGHNNTACICLSQRICQQIQNVTFRERTVSWGTDVFHPTFIDEYNIVPKHVLVKYHHIIPFHGDTFGEFSNFRRAMVQTFPFALLVDLTFRAAVVYLRVLIRSDRSIKILERNVHCTNERLQMMVRSYFGLNWETTRISTVHDVVVHHGYDAGWGNDYGR